MTQSTLVRGANAYLQTQVQSRSPVELVVMLYDGALKFLKLTVEAMERGDLVAKREAMSRAMAIFVHLQGTLNVDEGGPVAESLDSLYTYMTDRLTTANLQRERAPIDEVIQLLGDLREAWAQVAQMPPPTPAA